MEQTLILTGDVNLQGCTDPSTVFSRVAGITRSADVVFGNLECCFFEVPGHEPAKREGFYAPPETAEALLMAGFHAVGVANNVTYGNAAILSSLARLDDLGVAHTGAGRDRAEACKPAFVAIKGIRYGFVQRTSVYWPKNQEATAYVPGVAALKGHTAYHFDSDSVTRPGVPPKILTWADPDELLAYREELRALSGEVDVLVASHHWGLDTEVLAYQVEIAHAAIDSGADIVLGHGPHSPLGIEIYRRKVILYGTGSFSFEYGHHGRHSDWVGFFATVRLHDGVPHEVSIQLVRRSDRNETMLRKPIEEPKAVEQLVARSAVFGTELIIEDDRLIVWRNEG